MYGGVAAMHSYLPDACNAPLTSSHSSLRLPVTQSSGKENPGQERDDRLQSTCMHIGSKNCDYSGANRHQGEQSRFRVFIDGSPPGLVGIFEFAHLSLTIPRIAPTLGNILRFRKGLCDIRGRG